MIGCGRQPDAPTTAVRIDYAHPGEAKEQRFLAVMRAIAKSTRNDRHYHRLALQTKAEKLWFKKLMYRLWNREITRLQFIKEGVAKYPEHRYEFAYIANAFQYY